MWKIVYTLATGICTAVNSRDPQDGEGILHLDPTLCAWVNVYPERYKVEAGALVERPEWAEEQAAIEAEKTKESAIAAIAAQRYATETGGVMFGEYQILTDRESQQILDSALEKVRRGLVESIVWKCGNGKWLTIDEANAAQIEGLVLMHVQGAFAWEKSELEKLEV